MKITLKETLKILLAFVIWLIFSIVGGVVGAAVCLLCVLWVCYKIRKTMQEKEWELSGDFGNYAGGYNGLSQAEMTKILIQNELDRKFRDGTPVARKSVQWRVGLTVIYVVWNFLCINKLYDSGSCIAICSLLTVVYAYLFCYFSTLSVLYTQAKNNPGMEFAAIVREECTEAEAQKVKTLRLAGIALMAVSLVGFVLLRCETRWIFSEAGDGYAVIRCRPALLAQTELAIPTEHRGQRVVSIGEKAFADIHNLETVTMPDSVRSIGKQAFVNCKSLKNIRLSSSLQSIGSGAFKNCTELEQITLPDTLTKLQGEAFMNCSNLRSITIPESVTEIRGNSFDGCKRLADVTLHNGITDIHAYAFQGCRALQQITLPEGITEVHTYTFAECVSLKGIRIPSGVTKISAHAFDGCTSLTTVRLPDTLLEIRSSAFRDCSSLQTIQVPKGVSINERAFKDSPTKVKEKTISDSTQEKINQEIENKPPTDVYYYIYSKDDPEKILDWKGSKNILIIDDARFSEKLPENETLGQLNGDKELLVHLNAAKKAGMTGVKYTVYSQEGSNATGRAYFVGIDWEIDEIIAVCEQNVNEENNG